MHGSFFGIVLNFADIVQKLQRSALYSVYLLWHLFLKLKGNQGIHTRSELLLVYTIFVCCSEASTA